MYAMPRDIWSPVSSLVPGNVPDSVVVAGEGRGADPVISILFEHPDGINQSEIGIFLCKPIRSSITNLIVLS